MKVNKLNGNLINLTERNEKYTSYFII